jgi:hypothetical protein
MMMKCEAVRDNLGAWLDGEVGHPGADQIRGHLEGCPACLAEKKRLDQLQSSLQEVLRLEAATVPFELFWSGVERRIAEKLPWRLQLLDWLRPVFYPGRLAWAIPVVIVSILGLLSLDQILPEWPWVNKNGRTAVESIDAFGFNVAVFREYDTKTTVIWLFENQDDEEQSSAEPIQDDNPTF